MYDDCHRTFLQAIIHEGALSEDKGREFVVQIFKDNIPVENVVDQINSELSMLNMMVKSSTCEVTGHSYWVLTSHVMDKMAKFQTGFSLNQLELLRKIFSDIIESAQGYISSTHCLNLLSNLDNKMTKLTCETFINSMVEKKWLSYANGQYYIGPRSAAELIPYFKETYGDSLDNCMLCRTVIFHGKCCLNCQKKVHTFCLENYATDQDQMTCPNCNNSLEFEDELPEMEFSQYIADDTATEITGEEIIENTMEEVVENPSQRTRRHRY